ncbi:MAG: hypothetical protein ACYTKD_22450 [Planctomycetota bacterium]|jgi:hypothetical protein
MDLSVVEQLERAGCDVGMKRVVPIVAIMADERRRVLPAGEEVFVMSGDAETSVHLKRITELFAGDAYPPDFGRGPTPMYALFFAMIERTAVDFCSVTEVIEPDSEFQRLYGLLARRPDATDGNLLFSYMQAAVRLYMSLRDTSRAVFEAVAMRLAKSAKTFRTDPSSTNYFDVVGRDFL